MAKVAITEQHLTDIADAIRSKTGQTSATYLPSQMANAILTISGEGGIIPTGTISILENGTYNVTNYASANVSVPTGSTINNQDKTVNPSTSKQTVSADSGYTGLGTVTINAMPSGTAGTPTATKGSVSNHSVSITPSVTNTTGYITGSTKTGTAVTVTASELASGNKAITQNGTDIDVIGYSTVSVNVSSDSPTIQQLSITPLESEQTFNSSSVDGYKPVTVGAISSTYVGSGISQLDDEDISFSGDSLGAQVLIPTGYFAQETSKRIPNGSVTAPASISGTSATITTSGNTLTLSKTVSVTPNVTEEGFIMSGTAGNSSVSLTANVTVNPTPTASGATVTIPAGYYSSQTTKSVSSGSATAPASISGTAASVSTGTNTLTLTKTVSVTPTVSAGYVSSGTAGNSSVSLTASVTTKAAATITPTTTNQTIAAGTYLTGIQTILGDSDLVGSNIVAGAQIFGVNGQATFQKYYTGSSTPSSSLGSNGDIYLQE